MQIPFGANVGRGQRNPLGQPAGVIVVERRVDAVGIRDLCQIEPFVFVGRAALDAAFDGLGDFGCLAEVVVLVIGFVAVRVDELAEPAAEVVYEARP